jgi:hypothetical protein
MTSIVRRAYAAQHSNYLVGNLQAPTVNGRQELTWNNETCLLQLHFVK